jgi:hypothetical protein
MLLDDFYQETFHAPLVPPDSEETPPVPRGRMHIAGVGKRRDSWAGVAICRAAKKAISYQGSIWSLRFGLFPAKLFSLILGVLIFCVLYSEAT